MLRGLYTATAGMLAQQRKHDTVTNNIANMNTPGFKQNHMVTRSFPEMLVDLMEGKPGAETHNTGRLMAGTLGEEAVTLYVQGMLRETSNPFDFALRSDIQVPGLQFDGGKTITEDGERIFQPQAFFTVDPGDGGQRYTRNGKFNVNDLGELVTAEGYRVLGDNGFPISLIDPATQTPYIHVTVNGRGELLDPIDGQALVDANGAPIRLLLSRIDNPMQLVAEGTGLYRLEAEDGAVAVPVGPDDQVLVQQGFVEASNVDPTQAMVDMMTAARLYEANQKVIQSFDRSLEKTVNEVGRV